MQTNRENILAANGKGMSHKDSSTYWSYYTPILQVAYNLGWAGVDLSDCGDVTGYRYGEIPVCGISHNYAADSSERGLSLAAINGQPEIGSTVWFADRESAPVSGLLLPYRGSDGEPLILAYGLEMMD